MIWHLSSLHSSLPTPSYSPLFLALTHSLDDSHSVFTALVSRTANSFLCAKKARREEEKGGEGSAEILRPFFALALAHSGRG